MKVSLLFLPLFLADQDIDKSLSDIFDNEEARNERLTALKERISSLGGFDENYEFPDPLNYQLKFSFTSQTIRTDTNTTVHYVSGKINDVHFLPNRLANQGMHTEDEMLMQLVQGPSWWHKVRPRTL